METPPNISQGNVEYKSSQDRIREFVGKVKIILVDSPKGIYLLKRWTAAFIALSQMFIGVNNVMILFYALSFKSNILTTLHIFLCMVGFQLCIPIAMLSLNNYNGSTLTMNRGDRKFEHVFLGAFGIFCIIFGTITVLADRGAETTTHATFGHAAAFLILLSCMTGLCSNGQGLFVIVIKYVHILTGIFGFIASSLCFTSGLYRRCIEDWVPGTSVISFLVTFCCVYTAVISLVSFRSLFKY
ncbi:PREDICTED: uncharacterized protein LOC106121630 [Papilio xuthus]|uniref:Uncharacterized protein LOC106121630 n=1 Tax=Papilio xuthus TaxID=66420 RepID=A0AAJ7EDC4_PAPXU|nr:PREDICTED: uncharacterized protein LOC106121630 [Papilio xuthus]